jgi:hypothetical protein
MNFVNSCIFVDVVYVYVPVGSCTNHQGIVTTGQELNAKNVASVFGVNCVQEFALERVPYHQFQVIGTTCQQSAWIVPFETVYTSIVTLFKLSKWKTSSVFEFKMSKITWSSVSRLRWLMRYLEKTFFEQNFALYEFLKNIDLTKKLFLTKNSKPEKSLTHVKLTAVEIFNQMTTQGSIGHCMLVFKCCKQAMKLLIQFSSLDDVWAG